MHNTAAALGLFDGVHLGHRAVLQAAAAQRSKGLVPAAFTFQPELASFKGAEGFLYPETLKEHILRGNCGMETITSLPFAEIAALSGEEFVRDILCGQMHTAYAVCGEDFRFGKNAAWDASDLKRFGQQYGFETEIVGAVCSGGEPVSSTRIRTLLKDGDITGANTLLGEPYRILGEIVHGAHLGHTIGFATINQSFAPGQLVPRFGAYASETRTPEGWQLSVTNIGIKPTVGYTGLPLAETHILDYSGDLYGQQLEVRLTAFLRGEQRFDSIDALVSQLHADIARCRQLSGNYHSSNT
jgi:riboflavin kinase/FMN adenylyltransferase